MYLDGLIDRLRLASWKSIPAASALVTDINLDGKMDSCRPTRERSSRSFPLSTAAADWTSKGVPNSIMLAKPFAPAQLLTAVSDLLNSATPA
jgi:hypothetical protein